MNRVALYIAPAVTAIIVLQALFFFAAPIEWPGELSPVTLGLIVGYVMSWLFQKLPVLRIWYEGLIGADKATVLVSATVGAGLGVFVASVLAIAPPALAVEASLAGLLQVIVVVLTTLISSQARYLTAVKPRRLSNSPKVVSRRIP